MFCWDVLEKIYLKCMTNNIRKSIIFVVPTIVLVLRNLNIKVILLKLFFVENS